MRVFPISNYNQTRSFNFGIAQETSIEAALIFNEIDFWSAKSSDGWVYKTLEDLCERVPVSESTIRRAIDKIVVAGWLEKKVKKVDGTPKLHFRIIKKLEPVQVAQVEVSKMNTSKDLFKMNTSSKNSSTNSNTKATPFESTLADFKQHRKEMRRSITPRAYELVLLKLEQLAPGDDSAKIAILNQSIESGWSGVFGLKADNQIQAKRKGMVY